MKILGFKKYNEINSSRIRIKSKKIDKGSLFWLKQPCLLWMKKGLKTTLKRN